ncbi:hypothetical protein D9M73_42600 [compost metagenome]
MAQALQRVVHPRGRKKRQRLRLAGPRFKSAVGNAVVHGAQVGQVKCVAHQRATGCAEVAFYVVMLGKGKMHRDRLGAGADFQFHAVVLQQQPELFEVVLAIKIRPCQRGLIAAGASNKTVTQLRAAGCCQRARHGVGVDTHKRVAGPHVAGQGLACHITLHGAAQVVDLLLVNQLHLCERCGCIGVAGGGDEGWQVGHVVFLFLYGAAADAGAVLRKPIWPAPASRAGTGRHV